MRWPLRVLHVAQPHEAGVAACVHQLTVDQRHRGIDAHVAAPAEGQLGAALAASGAPHHAWEAARAPGPGLPAEVARLRHIVSVTRPDLVHLHSAKAGLAGRLLLRGRTPTVFQPHAWSFDAVSGPVHAATLRWERHATRWTPLLVCVSDAEQRRGQAAGVHARVTVVVPNGVDLQLLQPAGAPDRQRARDQLGLDNAPLAVCIGRLTEQKGQDLLLAAWPSVRAAVNYARLVLVGDGPLRDRLQALADASVQLVGARSDVPLWLAAADVVVLPSRWEGMPLVPLEAMARARSVVACDVTGVREALPPGADGLVPPGDQPALVRALVRRLQSSQLCADEGAEGRAHVERAHDVRDTVTRITRAYATLAPASAHDGHAGTR